MSAWKVWDQTSLYFITSTITDWYPVFSDIAYFEIITESLRYCRNNKGLRIHAYVVMLNHMHLIVSVAEGSRSLSEVMRDMKRHTSVEISDRLKKDGKESALQVFSNAAKHPNTYRIWQEGFHPKGIESETFCRQKLDYIHANPVRKGYVLRPEYWYYSSAGNYAGSVNTALQINNLFEM